MKYKLLALCLPAPSMQMGQRQWQVALASVHALGGLEVPPVNKIGTWLPLQHIWLGSRFNEAILL